MEFLDDLRMMGVDDAILKEVWRMWSGIPIYIPKFQESSLEERNSRIRKEFNGHNQRELAIKYNLEYSWIGRVIRGVECKKA